MRIRRATLDDAAAIAAIYGAYVRETTITYEYDPPDETEVRRRLAAIGEFYPWLVAEAEGGRIAGYVHGSRHAERAAYSWSADVAVYLHPDFHRQGLARRMYNILFPLLRAQGVHSLYAGISLPNEASLALHRGMGFEDVGTYRQVGFKFGRWLDATWLGHSFDDPPPTAPPRPFPPLDAAFVNELLAR